MTAFRRLLVALAVAAVVVALALDLWKPRELIGVDSHTYEAAARVGLQNGWSHSLGLGLNRRPLVELLLLAALAFEAWRPRRSLEAALTGSAEVGEPATA